jgi:uncharacterized membrane protein
MGLESQPVELDRGTAGWSKLAVVMVAVAVLIIVLAIVVSPPSLLDKADLVGYGICHQIPERSFAIAGRQLPLCARCTGTFLGAMLGLASMLLLRRHRASAMAPVSVLLALIVFFVLWGFDGLNSYMTLFPGAPHLYEPQNWLRLTTGMLNGLALVIFVFPIFNFTLWRDPTSERVIKSLGELAAILLVAVLLVLVVQAELDFLLYPLAILSSLGVLVMLVLINSMLAAVVLGREGAARSWREALVPLVVGLALGLLELAAMVLLRGYLTARLGLPF